MTDQLKSIPISDIKADPNNPRIEFPQTELNKLAESIDQVGILVPVVVYKSTNGYRLLDGERRWRTSQTLGLKFIPAIVVDEPDEISRLTKMFAIHQVREQWQDLPTARALQKLMTASKISDPVKLEEMTGISAQQIKRYQFALSLPADIQQKIEKGIIPLTYFDEVNNSVIRPLEKSRPKLFKKYGRDKLLDHFLKKRESGAVPDIVSLRNAKYIVLKAAEDDTKNKENGPLDKMLKELIDNDDRSVTEAYEDTVMVAVEADKLERRAEGLVMAFRRLLEQAADAAEVKRIKAVGAKLIRDLTSALK